VRSRPLRRWCGERGGSDWLTDLAPAHFGTDRWRLLKGDERRRELEEGRPAGVVPCMCWRDVDGRERQTSPLSKPLGKTAAGEAAVPRSPSRSSRARAKEATAEGVVRALGEGGVRHR
jgi:hypothetical protein